MRECNILISRAHYQTGMSAQRSLKDYAAPFEEKCNDLLQNLPRSLRELRVSGTR